MTDLSNDFNYMKSYLQHAFQFEQYVYVWKSAMARANNSIRKYEEERRALVNRINNCTYSVNNMGASVDYEKELLEKKIKRYKIIISVILLAAVVSFVLTFLLTFLLETDDIMVNILSAIMLYFFAFFSPLAVALLITVLSYRSTKSKLQSGSLDNQAKRNRYIAFDEITQCKNRLEQLDAFEANVRMNQQAIHKNLTDAQLHLQKIYSANVLPAKYRTLVATGTLYGYIIDGRCTCVKGHGGLYDTFENDYRLGLIILELKKVNASLSRIEANQRLLLQEMNKLNNTALRIEHSLNNIKSDISSIKCSTAISAVANQQTAAAASYMATVTFLNT